MLSPPDPAAPPFDGEPPVVPTNPPEPALPPPGIPPWSPAAPPDADGAVPPSSLEQPNKSSEAVTESIEMRCMGSNLFLTRVNTDQHARIPHTPTLPLGGIGVKPSSSHERRAGLRLAEQVRSNERRRSGLGGVSVLALACFVSNVSCNTRHDAPELAKPGTAMQGLASSAHTEESPPPQTSPPRGAAASLPDPPKSDVSTVERCRKFCAHTESLHCGPPEKCEQGCQQMLDANVCRVHLLKFFSCAEKEPVNHWQCAEGTPAIKDGWCDAQQAAFAACIQTAGAR